MKCTGCSAPVGLLFSGVTSEVDPALYDILPTQEKDVAVNHCTAMPETERGREEKKERKTDAAAFRLTLTEPTLSPISVKRDNISRAKALTRRSMRYQFNTPSVIMCQTCTDTCQSKIFVHQHYKDAISLKS